MQKEKRKVLYDLYNKMIHGPHMPDGTMGHHPLGLVLLHPPEYIVTWVERERDREVSIG